VNAAGHSIPEATDGRRVWLRVGTLLDGSASPPLRDAHVVYDRNGIVFVGDAGNSPSPILLNPGQRRPDADLPGHTLLPGLIEAHAHLFLEGGELDPEKRAAAQKQSPAALLNAAQPRLPRLVRLGILAVRDAGDKDGVGLALSALCKTPSRPLMPYVDSPGAAIHHRGRYGSFMAEPLEQFTSPRDCVEARVRAGADRIKLIPTGIINFKQGQVTAEPQMSVAEIAECVRAARSFSRQTFAHASGDSGIERAIQGGVDSIEHGFFIRDDQLAQLRDRQIAWVPTFAPVQKQVEHATLVDWDAAIVSNLKRILDQHAASLVKAQALGVRIIAGSDAGSYGVAHGYGLLEELECLERAGLSAGAVIHAATGAAAERLGFREPFGWIRRGCLSRFLLTRHSPLEQIANLRKEKIVVFDGSVLESDAAMNATGL